MHRARKQQGKMNSRNTTPVRAVHAACIELCRQYIPGASFSLQRAVVQLMSACVCAPCSTHGCKSTAMQGISQTGHTPPPHPPPGAHGTQCSPFTTCNWVCMANGFSSQLCLAGLGAKMITCTRICAYRGQEGHWRSAVALDRGVRPWWRWQKATLRAKSSRHGLLTPAR
jgi:hypothetical protein